MPPTFEAALHQPALSLSLSLSLLLLLLLLLLVLSRGRGRRTPPWPETTGGEPHGHQPEAARAREQKRETRSVPERASFRSVQRASSARTRSKVPEGPAVWPLGIHGSRRASPAHLSQPRCWFVYLLLLLFMEAKCRLTGLPTKSLCQKTQTFAVTPLVLTPLVPFRAKVGARGARRWARLNSRTSLCKALAACGAARIITIRTSIVYVTIQKTWSSLLLSKGLGSTSSRGGGEVLAAYFCQLGCSSSSAADWT